MKKLLLALIMLGGAGLARAQITIAAADMPVAGDSLRYSIAVDTTFDLGLGNTGANITWDYSGLNRIAQGRDDYKSAAQVSLVYALTVSANAYGYKIADSIPGSPVPVTDIYTFFSKKNNPSRFVAEAFAANLSGLPTAINYSNEDEWYFFPLQFNDVDSSDFKLSYSLSGFGSFSEQGTRKTTVDGWGTIQTPYFTTPVNCLRVRSEIEEVDSITFGAQSTGLPRHSVEYKWLVNGEHYPALWVVTNIIAGQEVPTVVRYRDVYHQPALGISQPDASVRQLGAYPNPAVQGVTTLDIPKDWKSYSVELFDLQGRLVLHQTSSPRLNISALSSGQYIARVTAGAEKGFVSIIK